MMLIYRYLVTVCCLLMCPVQCSAMDLISLCCCSLRSPLKSYQRDILQILYLQDPPWLLRRLPNAPTKCIFSTDAQYILITKYRNFIQCIVDHISCKSYYRAAAGLRNRNILELGAALATEYPSSSRQMSQVLVKVPRHESLRCPKRERFKHLERLGTSSYKRQTQTYQMNLLCINYN